eukprot:GHVN01101171.1.p3 GENE.GHVN01101171.1~~GHVN01101171.1.p3  ORF type:complete len:252 (-),score=29.74 GHVN01101171.1:1104-1859(-)
MEHGLLEEKGPRIKRECGTKIQERGELRARGSMPEQCVCGSMRVLMKSRGLLDGIGLRPQGTFLGIPGSPALAIGHTIILKRSIKKIGEVLTINHLLIEQKVELLLRLESLHRNICRSALLPACIFLSLPPLEKNRGEAVLLILEQETRAKVVAIKRAVVQIKRKEMHGFCEATKKIKKLEKRPEDKEVLELYSLYKQALCGDNNKERPSILDLQGRAKWSAWKSVEGMEKEKAMEKYIELVDCLLNKYNK